MGYSPATAAIEKKNYSLDSMKGLLLTGAGNDLTTDQQKDIRNRSKTISLAILSYTIFLGLLILHCYWNPFNLELLRRHVERGGAGPTLLSEAIQSWKFDGVS